MNAEPHVGPFQTLRYAGRTGPRIAILCPERHVITTMAADEWPHSQWESRTKPVSCHGAAGVSAVTK